MKTKWNYQRWINILVTLVLVLLLIGQGAPKQERQVAMAIDFSDVAGQGVNFGTVSAVQNLTNKTLSVLVDLDATTSGFVIIFWGTGGADEYWYMGINSFDQLSLYYAFSTTDGVWSSTDAITTGRHLITITYNNNATTNDPIFYIDGTPVAITESITPVGTAKSGTAHTLYIGGRITTSPLDGRFADLRIYNRILSAAEILDIYNSRCMNNNFNGLVFNPILYGAAGLQLFDGVSLAAGNTIIDPFSGAVGVPAGSPVGRAETYLAICP